MKTRATKKDRSKARRANKPAARRAVKRQRRENPTATEQQQETETNAEAQPQASQATVGAAPHDGTGSPVDTKMACGCEDGQHEPDCAESPVHGHPVGAGA